jgi:hypothetical protein
MLKLTVRRQPLAEHSYFAKKSFEATLSVEHAGVSDNDQRWLELTFAIKPDGKHGSLFNSAVYPGNLSSWRG